MLTWHLPKPISSHSQGQLELEEGLRGVEVYCCSCLRVVPADVALLRQVEIPIRLGVSPHPYYSYSCFLRDEHLLQLFNKNPPMRRCMTHSCDLYKQKHCVQKSVAESVKMIQTRPSPSLMMMPTG